MKAISKALLNLASSIELSSDDEINDDVAIKFLEQLSHDLSNASEAEIAYLKAVIRQEILEAGEERTDQQVKRFEFLLDFFEYM